MTETLTGTLAPHLPVLVRMVDQHGHEYPARIESVDATTITITVSDGTASASSSFLLTVNPVNMPPTIQSIADQTINEDASAGAIAAAGVNPDLDAVFVNLSG